MRADSADKPNTATGISHAGQESADRGWQWVLALLPAFPIVLLLLRLWHLSRQDLPTMLLLVQYVSPLGLVSALVITLVWVPPVIVLVGRALGALLLVSAPSEADPARSWLTRRATRTPHWVVAVFVMWAALTWHMRFLPALIMTTLAIVGLTVRHRHDERPRLVQTVCVALPFVVAVAAYSWLAPAIADAFRNGEVVTALLLLLPPGLAVLLTGPVPAHTARVVTLWPAATAALLAPFLVGAIFLRAPILPTVALEVDGNPAEAPPAQVVRGNVVTVDDRMTTLLDGQGSVQFVPNDHIKSKVLCPGSEQIPDSVIEVRGWHVEQSALEWIMPARTLVPGDPRCQGRPLDGP